MEKRSKEKGRNNEKGRRKEGERRRKRELGGRMTDNSRERDRRDGGWGGERERAGGRY